MSEAEDSDLRAGLGGLGAFQGTATEYEPQLVNRGKCLVILFHHGVDAPGNSIP